MPATYCSLHFHAVFSTKDRFPSITSDWRNNLHAYPGGIAKNLGGVPVAIGSIEDHAHVVVGLRATHRLDYFMREMKSGSSEWVHATVLSAPLLGAPISKLSFQWLRFACHWLPSAAPAALNSPAVCSLPTDFRISPALPARLSYIPRNPQPGRRSALQIQPVP